MQFLKSSIMPGDLNGGAWRDMIHKYKGYTGEETAYDHLRSAGHDVEPAMSPTQEGHDALIDGDRYNVKITDDPSYIADHLHHHPDIEVLTNTEMADAFAGNPHVHIDNALSAQAAFHSTAEIP